MNELVHLLSDLVAINSINPDLVPGAPGEAAIAAYVARWLEQAGLEVQQHEPVAGRPNVVGIARGTGGGKTLLLNGHLDTVGVSGMAQPHQPGLRAGRLYGRGAYDMKAGVAACMVAAAAACQRPLRGDVIFTAVMDEEYAGLGTLDIARHYRADAAIIAEPTELELIVAHKGFVWLEIETIGVAAHGSRPELGVDAIAKMGPVLVELERLDHALRAQPTHPLLASGSLHASLIQGGQELSSYPARCVLAVERRTILGETPELVEAQIQLLLDRIQQADPTFQAMVHRGVDRPPMEAPVEHGIVPLLQQTATTILQRTPPLSGAPYWTDAASLDAVGIPTVLFGPAGAGAHAVEEWVDLASVQACAEIYLAVAAAFCA
jgi:acetylornithine deacetylase